MFKKACIICMFICSTLILGCSQAVSIPLDVPSEYQHAEEMLNHLYQEGLQIQEINNSKYTAFLNTNPNYSMYIKTDLGIFELVHLEQKNSKDIDIVMREANDNGEYVYAISVNGEEQLLIKGSENFFNKSDEYITITREKELNDKIKQALEAQ